MKISFVTSDNPESKKIKEKISKFKFVFIDDVNPEVVISIGGDGTFLRSVCKFIDIINDVDILAINTGHLGFYSSYCKNEISNLESILINKDYKTHRLSLLKYQINNLPAEFALNEITVTNPPKVFNSIVSIDDFELEYFQGSGLCISTQSGSTAMNKSLSGSIIDNKIKCMQISEIASINNKFYKTIESSVVVAKDRKITLETNNENLMITKDHTYREYESVKSIKITLADKKVNLISAKDDDFYYRVKRAFL